MTLVGLLTIEQKNDIFEMYYAPDSFFNPIQDADDNWIISTQEIEFCVNSDFIWVKELPLIEYKPQQTDF